MIRLARSFFARVRRGEIIKPLYLVYYYLYLMSFDLYHGTRFAVSHKPSETGVPTGGTGNFPAHPRLVRKLLLRSGLKRTARIIDIGHGSGAALYVASLMGYKNLTGIEYSSIPFKISQENLSNRAELLLGDALDLDLTNYDAIFFFSPFRGEVAQNFVARVPDNIQCIIAVNNDPAIEPLLYEKGYMPSFTFAHPIYSNFKGKIWIR